MHSLLSVISALLSAAGSNLRVMGLPNAAEATTVYGPAIFQVKVLASPAIVATITSAEQSITVTGLKAGDIIMSGNKPTQQAGLGFLTGRAAANAWFMSFVNPSAAGITPTASEVYDLLVFRPAF